ncbi:hypothetical protein EJ05DRAFT_267383 [Pseudovirgaria hyperparasitica]|uniref:Uncharacterized protein n=1 Tax=Pseudovirgaria hyperparasitica TaxID=470096 RepID=A0A6A6VSH7_9PEZI|nr:uncharacterized protein EJ05DRAFT_267383 [Pseudovirgaria hyperparasitica]KAF2752736.1 hypothetical protein EJ05DRAFT_267383 [Pseudovirgaria hyperparasitica]
MHFLQLPWLPAALLLYLAQAQNATGPPYSACGFDSIDISQGSFNATGSFKFSFGTSEDVTFPLYYSVAVESNDTRGAVYSYAFLSWPESISTPPNVTDRPSAQACIYDFGLVNATSTNPMDSNESCQGVLSEECLEVLNNFSPPPGSCQNAYRQSEIATACGMTLPNHISIGDPVNLTDGNDICTIPNLPDMNMPDGYLATRFQSVRLEGPDLDTAQIVVAYDTFVRQAHVAVISLDVPLNGSSTVSGGYTKAFCLAPSNISAGSRQPELPAYPSNTSTDDDSAAARSGITQCVYWITTLALTAVSIAVW